MEKDQKRRSVIGMVKVFFLMVLTITLCIVLGWPVSGHALETDVIVVGGGGSGLAAAVSAAEKGAKVIILEEKSIPGGTTNFPAGIFAVESKIQKDSGITLTRNEVFTAMMEFTHYMSNAKLTKAIIDKSASTIEWLQTNGVEFVTPMFTLPGGQPTFHLVKGQGAALVRALFTKAKGRGVDIKFKAKAENLIKNGNRIEGIVAVIEGKAVNIKSKAVILATGGYGSNKEWMKKYTGFEIGKDIFPTVDVGLMGDGQRMAWDAGAAKYRMDLLEIEYDVTGPGLMETQFRVILRQPYIWVNLQGERLGNEERLSSVANYAGNAVSKQTKKEAYMIFDDETRKRMEKGFDRQLPNFLGRGDMLVDFEEQLKKIKAAGNKEVVVASSIKDLCAKTGINTAGIEETLTNYNISAEKKSDEQFGKDPKFLHAVKTAPFYAIRITPSYLGTLGGIKVNSKLEVLNTEDEVIPGLYAVGNIASGMYGDTYCIVFPGTTFGFAMNSGRIAGENAAKYAKK